jgi:hypothetical protein
MARLFFGRLAFLVPALAAAALLPLAGCGDTAKSGKTNNTAATVADKDKAEGNDKHDDGDHGHHDHAEKGPHNGALIAVGGHDAHVELLLDSKTGKLTAWILDGKAKKSIPIMQKSLELGIMVEPEHENGKDEKPDDKHDEEIGEIEAVELAAVSPAADGSVSQFEGQFDLLKTVQEFEAVLVSITVGGKTHKQVKFSYPEGNEHGHPH